MPATLNDLLHTLGNNVVFRTEQEQRDFHDGVNSLDETPADEPPTEDAKTDGDAKTDEKPSPRTVAAKAGGSKS